MQQIASSIPRKEQTLFDFTCCVNELLALMPELSHLEVSQMDQLLKNLCSTLHNAQRPSHQLYQHVA